MKSIKWIAPLVAASVLVISGCSQTQQSVKPANAANRLTTGTGAGTNGLLGRRNGLGVTAGSRTASGLGPRSTSTGFGGAAGSSAYGDGNNVSRTTGFGNDDVGSAGGLVGGDNFDNRIGGVGGDYKVTDLDDPNSILSRRVIYFAYDQSSIEPEYMEILDAHAELLASNPKLTVLLEGHADERGSREYNVALSERRAQSVKNFMSLKGAGAEQSQTVAYGEEEPVATGHNEEAWSKNRRVEIKYIGR